MLRKIGAANQARPSLGIHRENKALGLSGNRPCSAQSLVHSADFSYSSKVHPHIGGAMVQRLARSPFKAKIRVRFPLALPSEFEIFSVLHGWPLTTRNFGPSSAAGFPMAYFMTLFFKEPL